MPVYVLTFLFATFLSWVAEGYKDKRKMKNCAAFLLLICIVFSVVAGLRATSVGLDVTAYALPYFDRALTFDDPISYLASMNADMLYAALCYFSAQVFQNIGFLFFFSQLLVVGPLYWSAFILRKRVNLVVVTFVYSFAFFNISLCLMRQFIACAFLVLAFTCYFSGRGKRAIVFVVIACLFHKSAVFALPIFLFCAYFRNRKVGIVQCSLLLCLTAAVVASIPLLFYLVQQLIPSLVNQGSIVDQHMQAGDVGTAGFVWRAILCVLPAYGLYQLSRKESISSREAFIVLLPIVGFILSFTAFSAEYFARITYYFYIFWMFSLMYINKVFSDLPGRILLNVGIGIGFVGYWYFTFIVANAWGTANYVFAF